MPAQTPIDAVDLASIDLDPHFVPRVPDPREHVDYLDAAHESTYRNLAVIALLLGKGETTLAALRLKQLRDHLDVLWSQRRDAARQGKA